MGLSDKLSTIQMFSCFSTCSDSIVGKHQAVSPLEKAVTPHILCNHVISDLTLQFSMLSSPRS